MAHLDFEGQSLKEAGYRMPAEWEEHEATWLTWPKKADSWPGKIEKIPPVWINMMKGLLEGEKVRLLVDNQEMEAVVLHLVKEAKIDSKDLEIYIHETDDSWMRDSGAIFVKNEKSQSPIIGLNWEYNAWGGKYPPFDKDNRIPSWIGGELNIPIVSAEMVLEGGSIDTDGAGHLLTTTSCLLNPNRNPSMSQEEIEHRLKDFLGVDEIYWLGDGIVGDDTDGHVDDITRFVAKGRILTAIEEKEEDENFKALRENKEALKTFKDRAGSAFEIIDFPMPDPVYHEGHRLPASYANFYIGNSCILLPVFNQKKDKQAEGILRDLFPDRKIHPVFAEDLVWGLGACHCVTQQQPAV